MHKLYHAAHQTSLTDLVQNLVDQMLDDPTAPAPEQAEWISLSAGNERNSVNPGYPATFVGNLEWIVETS